MDPQIFIKMRLKKGTVGMCFQAPAPYLDMIIKQDIVRFNTHDHPEFVHLFVESKQDYMNHRHLILPYIHEDTRVWISWKKSTKSIIYDINRDTLNTMVMQDGLRPYANVALDETWSALGYRKVKESS
jgi:hypothetical protein